MAMKQVEDAFNMKPLDLVAKTREREAGVGKTGAEDDRRKVLLAKFRQAYAGMGYVQASVVAHDLIGQAYRTGHWHGDLIEQLTVLRDVMMRQVGRY